MSNMGVDLKVKQGMGGGMPGGNKAAPRKGAAMGQGNGMGGYNAGAVGRAMAEVKGGTKSPQYFAGAGMGLKNK